MSFQAILNGIEEEGQLQIQMIDQEAGRIVTEINLTAEQTAGERRKRILSDGRARLNRERAIIDQQASVKVLQIHADARQELIEEVLENVRESFRKIRHRKDYDEFLEMKIHEVVRSLTPSLLEDQEIILHFDACDKKAVAIILKQFDQPANIQYDIETYGGCNGESDDGKVITLNTVETRFLHVRKFIQQKLSVFFEEKISSA